MYWELDSAAEELRRTIEYHKETDEGVAWIASDLVAIADQISPLPNATDAQAHPTLEATTLLEQLLLTPRANPQNHPFQFGPSYPNHARSFPLEVATDLFKRAAIVGSRKAHRLAYATKVLVAYALAVTKGTLESTEMVDRPIAPPRRAPATYPDNPFFQGHRQIVPVADAHALLADFYANIRDVNQS